jgi:casein kinase II subunit alpha
MASGFKVGQCIEGKVSTYILSKQLHKDIWTATYQALTRSRSSHLGKVIIKSAPKYRLDNERDILKHFHARLGIRQLLDETQDPPSLVLEQLDDNLLTESNSRLEKPEIKFIAKSATSIPRGWLRAYWYSSGSLLLNCFRFWHS